MFYASNFPALLSLLFDRIYMPSSLSYLMQPYSCNVENEQNKSQKFGKSDMMVCLNRIKMWIIGGKKCEETYCCDRNRHCGQKEKEKLKRRRRRSKPN